jgi:hypothetical protein
MGSPVADPTASQSAAGDEVVYPTIEASETHELSQYLESLVREQIIPREIATVLNHLSDLQLQKEGVTRFLSGQSPLAWQIVRDLLNPSLNQTDPWKFGIAKLWANRILRYSLMGFSVLACLIWVASFPDKPVIQPSPQKIATTLPKPVEQNHAKPHVPTSKEKPHSRVSRKTPIRRNANLMEVPVPTHLEGRPMSGKEAILTWKSVGKDYTYTVYSAADAAMHDPQKIFSQIPINVCTFHRQAFSARTYWFAVSATDAKGQEGDLSETVRIKL